jgi:hypothetical protein
MDLDRVISNKPVSDPKSKFDMAEMLLDDDPLATFRDFRRNVCHTIAAGDLTEAGETDATFKSVLNRWLRHYFPHLNQCPATKQKKYMRCMLKKPRGVQVKQIFGRIQQMNALLPMFPGPDNTMFSESDVIDIIMSMCPASWRTQMAKMNFEPCGSTLLELQTTLEKIELIEKCDNMHIDNKKMKSDKDDHKKKGSFEPKKSKFSKYKFGDQKGCEFCKILGGKPETHSTENCFFKDKVKSAWIKNRPMKNHSYSRNEMNVLVEKKAKALIKKQLKKQGLNYETSGSESNEE